MKTSPPIEVDALASAIFRETPTATERKALIAGIRRNANADYDLAPAIARLDALLAGLCPLLARGELRNANQQARAFVIAEAMPGRLSLYRWDDDASFVDFLDTPRGGSLEEFVSLPFCADPGPEEAALIKVLTALYHFARRKTPPRDIAGQKLLDEAQNYLWHHFVSWYSD